MKKLIFTISLSLCAAIWGSLIAQTANISVQGVLRKSNGTAVENGQYQVTFKLWDAATNGNLIWQETKSNVDVEGGIYSVTLGDGATILDAEFDQPYYLGVSVENGTELIPRARLTSSPYALSLIGSDNVFPNSGNVGVGAKIEEATSKLTIKDGTGVIGVEPGTTANFTAKIQSTTEGLKFNNPSNKDFIFENAGVENMRIKNGNIGLGTNNPQRRLHVKGNHETMRLEGESTSFLSFYKESPTDRSGYIGYVYGDNSIMKINNEDGGTEFISDYIRLKPTTTTYNHGRMEVHSNGSMFSLHGTDHAYMEFYPLANQGRKAYLGFGGGTAHLALKNERTGGNLELKASQDVYISGGDNRTVFVGEFLRVTGSKNISMNDYAYLIGGNSSVHYLYGHHTATNYEYSIHADHGIRAPRFHQKSDRRIKKDFQLSDGEKDLAKLKAIEVTDYRHIDEVRDGNAFRKGLIAQQVESVFPQAIEKGKEYIPNVFSFPVSIAVENTSAQFVLPKAHDFEVGDNIKIMTADGEAFFEVATITNEKSFTINNWEKRGDAKEFFIYGKEVDDFRTVDYDRVFTLAVSATQELARKIEALEKENARLRMGYKNTQRKNDELNATVEVLDARLKTIERLFETTSQH